MNFFTAINRQIPLMAIFGALLLLGWTLQHHLLETDSSSSNTSPFSQIKATESVASNVPIKLTASELNQIAARHLFGTLQKPKVAVKKPVEPPKTIEPDFSNLPETRIPLKLSGIAFSPDKDRAFAMIITANGKQADYQAGEAIGKEAKVHLIEEKRVVIERDGKFEALSLPEISKAAPNRARPPRAAANRSTKQPLYGRPAPIRPAPNKQK